jgi:asparagine N-glycosylation enzyme membrane subunit Stt3
MNWQAYLILTTVLGILLLIEQRADPSSRKAVRYFTYFSLLLLAIYVWWYGSFREAGLALISAGLFAGLFWLVVGRYNPASSSEDIRVLGMDD